MKSFFLIIVSISILFSSCKKKLVDVQSVISATPATVSPPTFQQALATKLNPIFRDDFVDNRNNWHLRTDDTVSTTISNGFFNFVNETVYNGYITDIPIAFEQTKDFTITTSITKTSGVDDYGFGLVWGESKGKYFQFYITQTGYYRIDNWDGTNITIIKDWTQCTIASDNKLQIVKQGSNYFFFLNDINLFTAPFQTLYGNEIGFCVFKHLDSVKVDYLEVDQ